MATKPKSHSKKSVSEWTEALREYAIKGFWPKKRGTNHHRDQYGHTKNETGMIEGKVRVGFFGSILTD